MKEMEMLLDTDRRQALRAQVTAAIMALGSLVAALTSNLFGVELACDFVIAVWAIYLIVFIFGRTSDLRAMDLVDDEHLHDN